MRVLFSSNPIHGHLLPLLPLATAAQNLGAVVAVATSTAMAEVCDGLRVIPAGPSLDELLAANDPRKQRVAAADHPIAEFFAGTRVDHSFRQAMNSASAFHPDVVIAEQYDAVGPMIAAALKVPWVRHDIGLPTRPALASAMKTSSSPRYATYGLSPVLWSALVDPWPDGLQMPGYRPPDDRIRVRAEPFEGRPTEHQVPYSDRLLDRFSGREERPLVLITLGTVLKNPMTLQNILDAVAPLDVNLLAASAPGVDRGTFRLADNVQLVGFTAMSRLLATRPAVVVSAGGAGTLLAALTHGIPLVLWPVGAEKPLNAERAAAAGAAIVIDGPEEAYDAVQAIFADHRYRAAAGRLRAEIAATPSPTDVFRHLIRRLDMSGV